jgi:3-deoxy-D-manno-octulosonic-acid transferase
MMWMFYYIGVGLYGIAARIFALFSGKARLWVQGRRKLLTNLAANIPQNRQVIWMHCASLGEFEMGRPVLETIRKQYPDKFILLTFFSPSGYEVRKNYPGADLVSYLPLDLPQYNRRFLDVVKPSLALFVKYEFWFGFMHGLYRRNVPLVLISGRFRKDQLFFRWYGNWFFRKLSYFDSLHVQDIESANLVGKEFASRVIVSGDTRFDRVMANAALKKELPEINAWLAGRPCMVAGSTWPIDDPLMLPWEDQEMALIIAPHEVDPHRIQTLKQLAGEDAVLYSELPQSHGRILIVDNVGMLLSIYALAKLAYVGGGFGSGLHNILEPAAFGLPVLFGPEHKKFPEAAALEKTGAAQTIFNRKTFDVAKSYYTDSRIQQKAATAAKQFVASHAGASEKIMQTIHELLK